MRLLRARKQGNVRSQQKENFKVSMNRQRAETWTLISEQVRKLDQGRKCRRPLNRARFGPPGSCLLTLSCQGCQFSVFWCLPVCVCACTHMHTHACVCLAGVLVHLAWLLWLRTIYLCLGEVWATQATTQGGHMILLSIFYITVEIRGECLNKQYISKYAKERMKEKST